MSVIIFANGELALPPDWQALLENAERLIAADGGARHLLALGLQPDVVVGDMDSLSAQEREELAKMGAKLRTFPAEKNQTDLELALVEAQEAGATQVTVLAALGRRWDHSLANILLATQTQFAEMAIEFLHGEQRLFLIRDEASITAEPGTRLSLIPLGGDAIGVQTTGVTYPLDAEDLPFGSSRGVSNQFETDRVEVKLREGMLLCILSPAELN